MARSRVFSKATLYIPKDEELFDAKIPSEMSNFTDLFNINPKETISNLRSTYRKFADPYYLARVLSTSQGMSLYRRSDILFNPAFQPEPLLFFFFTSLNTEFTTVIESASVFFSLFSFPNNEFLLDLIFEKFAEAYLSKNQNSHYRKNQVIAISVAFVLFCAKSTPASLISPDEFKSYFAKSLLSDEDIFLIYSAITNCPLSVRYTFGTYYGVPILERSSQISIKKTLFKLSKNIYLKTSGYWLGIFSDQKYQNLRLKILLYNITANVHENDDLFDLDITNNSNSKLIIGSNKAYDGPKYTITGSSSEELSDWASLLNYISFLCTTHGVINNTVAKGDIKAEF